MKYQLTSQVSGGWVNKNELKSGQKATIKTEAKRIPSQFKNPDTGEQIMQDTCKVHFDGQKEPVNCNLNKPTVNALIKAFGDESADWIEKPLTVEVEKVRVGGKASLALYLVPKGYKKVDDENGYAVIVKEGEEPSKKSETDKVNAELAGKEKDDEQSI